MRPCKNCRRDISRLPKPRRGPAPSYCDPTENPECKRERDAERKARERAAAYNAYTRVVLELPERPKRKTSSQTDADSLSRGEFDWDGAGGGRAWDEISKAWYPPGHGGWRVLPASRGPEIRNQWSDVDRLMAAAELAVRRLDRSAGTPVGQLREPRRILKWEVDADVVGPPKERTIIREGEPSAGELWLRGRHQEAIDVAEKQGGLAAENDLGPMRRIREDDPPPPRRDPETIEEVREVEWADYTRNKERDLRFRGIEALIEQPPERGVPNEAPPRPAGELALQRALVEFFRRRGVEVIEGFDEPDELRAAA
jgi:hypothetical protein